MHLLRNTLHELGIRAIVANDAVQLALGDVPGGWATAPRVIVDEQHAELARRVAVEFDAGSRAARLDDDDNEDDDDGDRRSERRAAAPGWPLCPSCGVRRQAICPYCGVSGDGFPAAEFSFHAAARILGDEPSALGGTADSAASPGGCETLQCSTCDEPFEAQYGRICAECGHDFRNGVESVERLPGLLFSPGLWIPVAAAALVVFWKPALGAAALIGVAVAAWMRHRLEG